MTLGGWSISFELYSWVRDNLGGGGRILELGSGAGTIKLLDYYTVYSIEHNGKWLDLDKRGKYIWCPIVDYGTYKWYNRDTLRAGMPGDYDLILVDGPTAPIGRWGFVKNIHLFKTDIPIILDDTNREPERLMAEVLAFELKKEATEYGDDEKKFTVLI